MWRRGVRDEEIGQSAYLMLGRWLMQMDAKLDSILGELEVDDGEEPDNS